MPATRFRDVIEELEVRRITRAQLADEAGVSEEHVAYWIALAELTRFQGAADSGADTSCSS